MSNLSIGDTIRLLREEKGWNQRQLAEKAGLTPSTISYIELGTHEPRYLFIECIIEAMGYKLEIVRKK